MLIQKRNKNDTIIDFVLRQVRFILFNTNLMTKNDISFVKTALKML